MRPLLAILLAAVALDGCSTPRQAKPTRAVYIEIRYTGTAPVSPGSQEMLRTDVLNVLSTCPALAVTEDASKARWKFVVTYDIIEHRTYLGTSIVDLDTGVIIWHSTARLPWPDNIIAAEKAACAYSKGEKP